MVAGDRALVAAALLRPFPGMGEGADRSGLVDNLQPPRRVRVGQVDTVAEPRHVTGAAIVKGGEFDGDRIGDFCAGLRTFGDGRVEGDGLPQAEIPGWPQGP